LTFFASKLDSPVIKTLKRVRFSSNQNIGEGESNFDEKMLKKCSEDISKGLINVQSHDSLLK